MEWEEFEWQVKAVRYELPRGGFVQVTDDTRVQMGDAFTFRQLTVTLDTARIVFEVDNGVPGCVSIELRADKHPLRAKDLTSIRLDDLREEAFSTVGLYRFDPNGDDYQVNILKSRRVVEQATTRRKVTPEFLSRVAEIHQSAPKGGRLAAVVAAFSVSERQALRYIKQARNEGVM